MHNVIRFSHTTIMQNSLTKTKSSTLWMFLACALLPVAAGTLCGYLSGSFNGYEGLNMPSFALPDWVYGVIWTILYVLMGISLYLILNYPPLSGTERNIRSAFIALWSIQFVLSLIWPFVFFNIDHTAAFVINCALVGTVTSLVTLGFFIRPLASSLLLPYWAWLLFATYQTLMVIVLNL